MQCPGTNPDTKDAYFVAVKMNILGEISPVSFSWLKFDGFVVESGSKVLVGQEFLLQIQCQWPNGNHNLWFGGLVWLSWWRWFWGLCWFEYRICKGCGKSSNDSWVGIWVGEKKWWAWSPQCGVRWGREWWLNHGKGIERWRPVVGHGYTLTIPSKYTTDGQRTDW